MKGKRVKLKQFAPRAIFLTYLFSLVIVANACGGGPADNPQTVVDHYYLALKSDDNDTAIKYLQVTNAPNPGMNVTTAEQLQAQEQSAQSFYGPIKSYKINKQSMNGQSASVNVTITRSSPYTMDVQLSQINGAWIITGGVAPNYLY